MFTMNWEEYYDRVLGCWMGKCISGNIGAPYEGCKRLLNVEYDKRMLDEMLPNDDLDLQVLWLDVIERVGPDFTSRDLAEAFSAHCPYSPGEYATLRKNFHLGIDPPLSGLFNNNYYIEGMGCPIRSEIWACLAPCNPRLASALAAKDGCLDHAGESVTAERFLASLESVAFGFKGTVRELIGEALSCTEEGKCKTLIRDVLTWCGETSDPRRVFGCILRKYGHPDCTNMYQNIGITLMALLLGGEDFMKTTLLALNCGFDTDCTCATVGAILGLRIGGKKLKETYGFGEQTYKLALNISRRSDRIADLAEDTCLASLLFLDRNDSFALTGAPALPGNRFPDRPAGFAVSYENDDPTITAGETKTASLTVDAKEAGTLALSTDSDLVIVPETAALKPGRNVIRVSCTLPPDTERVMNRNLIRALMTSEGGNVQEERFGFAGAAIWRVYGPFWKNYSDVPPLNAFEAYYPYLTPQEGKSPFTVLRQFHLNMKAPWEEEIMEDALLRGMPVTGEYAHTPEAEGFVVPIRTDRFSLEEIMGFSGNCVCYLLRELYSPEEATVCLQIGHSDRFRLWLNGKLLAQDESTDHWTPENVHVTDVKLNRGYNRLLVKLARTNGKSDFSLMFTRSGPCSEHLFTFGSKTVPGKAGTE